jgi:hypothetical protein
VLKRRERTFYGATRKEAEAMAELFVASTNGKIFFSAPVLAPPLPNRGIFVEHKWQVDVEYFEEGADAAPLPSGTPA